MLTVNENKLKKGISILYEMELNNFMTEKAITELSNEINLLGKSKTFAYHQKCGESFLNNLSVVLSIFAGIGAFIGGIIGVISTVTSFEDFFSCL